MMATEAIHHLGDISRGPEPDICYVHEEHDDHYIGNWVTGHGFIRTKFPKETTRNLTNEEIEEYSKKWVQLSSYEPYQLKHVKEKCKKERKK